MTHQLACLSSAAIFGAAIEPFESYGSSEWRQYITDIRGNTLFEDIGFQIRIM
jgi:hypothetical protein